MDEDKILNYGVGLFLIYGLFTLGWVGFLGWVIVQLVRWITSK